VISNFNNIACLEFLNKTKEDDSVQGYLLLSSSYPQANINPFQQSSEISNISWPPIIAWYNIKPEVNNDY
jgi:hypothetical protein